MGWIARSALASAVSNAGAMGIIETSSGELDAVRDEIARMKDLTDKPFGVNIAQAFVADPTVIVDFVISQGVRFVTTSAGSPTRYTAQLKDAGLTVFHVVPTLRAAAKAVEAGVDGLIVEGGEGGGFKNPRPVSTMVLLPIGHLGLRRAGDRSRGFPRRGDHGGGIRPRGGGCAARHRHARRGRVPRPPQLEAGDRRRRDDRHRPPQPARLARPAGAAHSPLGGPRIRPRTRRHGGVRERSGAVLRRGPGGRDRPRRPGGRPHRRRPSGGRDHPVVRTGLRGHDRLAQRARYVPV